MNSLKQYITEKFKLNSKNISKYNYHPKTRNELKELVDKLIKERGNDANLNDIDTSQIDDMEDMFIDSKFNGDISNWDVSNVENMRFMFNGSKFNGDISEWDVSKVKVMDYMFADSEFNGDISEWDVNNVKNMFCMFQGSKFNGDISTWNVNKVEYKYMNGMFNDCPLEKNPPKWYHE